MSFTNGVIKDKAAVSAAITTSWSNGQTEGQITELKLVKHAPHSSMIARLFFAKRPFATDELSRLQS
jgi:hypothetical protein